MVGTNLKAETMKLMDERASKEAEMDVIIQRLCQPGGPGLSGNLVDSEANSFSLLYGGFPRTDIDIPTVRADRRRLSELRNDHKIMTEKIDQNIQVLHSARLASTPSVKDSGGFFPSILALVDKVTGYLQIPVAGGRWQVLTIHFVPFFQDDTADVGVQGSAVNIGSSSSPGNYIATAATSAAMDVDVVFSRPFAVIDEITEASPAAEDGLQLGDQVVRFGNVQSGENLLQRLAAEVQSNQGCAVSMTVMRQVATSGSYDTKVDVEED
ncbi:GTP-binding family protein [Capsicum annuum]|nr:GTP-binding family protein [Capsicum annuum]